MVRLPGATETHIVVAVNVFMRGDFVQLLRVQTTQHVDVRVTIEICKIDRSVIVRDENDLVFSDQGVRLGQVDRRTAVDQNHVLHLE